MKDQHPHCDGATYFGMIFSRNYLQCE